MSRPDRQSTRSRARPAGSPAALWAVVIVGAAASALALIVARSAPLAVESQILRALRNAGDPDNVGGVIRDLTALGSNSVLALFTAVAVLVLAFQRRWTAALAVLCVIGGGRVLATLAKHAVDRARPDIIPHLMLETSPSFPSAHAMMSMIAYVTFAVLIGRSLERRASRAFLVAAALALSLAIGLTRLYLGVHWPSDVLAGWCLGLAWLAIWGLVVGARTTR